MFGVKGRRGEKERECGGVVGGDGRGVGSSGEGGGGGTKEEEEEKKGAQHLALVGSCELRVALLRRTRVK
jgi:hypothetical protein